MGAPASSSGGALTPLPSAAAGLSAAAVPVYTRGSIGKGGVGGVPPAPPTPATSSATTPAAAPAGFAPLAPQGQFNVNQASAGALQQALQGTQRAIGNTGLFTSYVTDQTLMDLERQRQMQQDQIGLQASRAGAYGGSRHGVAEALTNEAFARQGAQTFGELQLGQQKAQMQGAAQLGQLGQQAFQTGQAIQQQQAQQGLLQQGMMQALIDAARGQYAGYTGAPQAALGAPLAALGAMPNTSTTTTSQDPGLYSYLQTAVQLAALSDARLKKNVTAKGKIGNVNFYTWDWNDAGKKIADPAQPTFGVIADELQKTHPHLVSRGNDGYLRVNYAGLASELENAA